MVRTSLEELISVTGGRLLCGDSSVFVDSVVTDSREGRADALYIPIIGATNDGHAFIGNALENGCSGTLVSDEKYYEEYRKNHSEDAYGNHPKSASENDLRNDRFFLLVDDTEKAFHEIAKNARKKLSLKAVGVTGSVGKTTTREMIAAALSGSFATEKTGKNYNNRFGLPLTLCQLPEDAELAVLELGMNVRGELGTISALCDLDCAVITNIGVAHIEYYGTQDEITKEKLTVTRGFDGNPEEKALILNADDPYLMKYKNRTGFPVILYGTDEEAAYRVTNVRMENGKYVYDLYINGEFRLSSSLSVLGRHNLLNAAAAFAVADRYGADLEKAAEGMAAFKGYQKRLERIEHNGILIIDDTYNASPSSMKAGLDVLCDLSYGDGTGKKIAVLGDMFELGDQTKGFHYSVGEYAVGKPFDVLFTVGVNSSEIARAMKENGSRIEMKQFPNRQALARELKDRLRPGDIVYIKASHGMMLDEVTAALLK